MIKTLVLQEAIVERRDEYGIVSQPRRIVNMSSENAIEVTIEIHNNYSVNKIKEALTKIFERAIACFDEVENEVISIEAREESDKAAERDN